ncbi:hypothetical protein [Paenibacillus assamensis]|uniref:hypothetical protein n=1 Tax=Paenibacillus assamensis TaxID=311244 RepID=UPI00040E9052|nr:hypothetical protein [Paenibacillus assamensis]
MKKFKSLLLLVFVLVLSVSSSVLAKGVDISTPQITNISTEKFRKLSGQEIDRYFQMLTPYFIYKDHNVIELDVQRARKDNISNEAIGLISKLLDNQNRILKATLRGGTFNDVKIDSDFNEVFDDYFTHLSATKISLLSSSCKVGGTKNPDPCPARETLIDSISLAGGQKFAIDSGYHRTARYAGGGDESNPARDFTKEVVHNDCSQGVFRNQIVLSDNKDGTFKVMRQQNEPNPELHEYTHPYALWSIYVYWWHQSYC